MANNNDVISNLNDLIEIQNDRVVGYQKALEELKSEDSDLRTLFQKYITESSGYKRELQEEVSRLGGTPDSNDTTNSGKLYRVWMDVKAIFTGHDRKTVLANCEFGEDAAQKAYEMALKDDDANYESSLRDLLVRQKAQLRVGHDEVKALRDAA